MSTPAAGFTLAEIGQIALPVSEINRAVAFYRDTLGMRFLFQFGNLAFFDCAGLRLLLDVPEKPEFRQHGSVNANFFLDDCGECGGSGPFSEQLFAVEEM